MKKAEYSPMTGETPATNAKATASGTKAKATVSPERTSARTELPRATKKSNMNQLGGETEMDRRRLPSRS